MGPTCQKDHCQQFCPPAEPEQETGPPRDLCNLKESGGGENVNMSDDEVLTSVSVCAEKKKYFLYFSWTVCTHQSLTPFESPNMNTHL